MSSMNGRRARASYTAENWRQSTLATVRCVAPVAMHISIARNASFGCNPVTPMRLNQTLASGDAMLSPIQGPQLTLVAGRLRALRK